MTYGWSINQHGDQIRWNGPCSLHVYTSGHRADGTPQHLWAVYRDGELMASGKAADEADARTKAVMVGASYAGETA